MLCRHFANAIPCHAVGLVLIAVLQRTSVRKMVTTSKKQPSDDFRERCQMAHRAERVHSVSDEKVQHIPCPETLQSRVFARMAHIYYGTITGHACIGEAMNCSVWKLASNQVAAPVRRIDQQVKIRFIRLLVLLFSWTAED